jgi:hypothetical protein
VIGGGRSPRRRQGREAEERAIAGQLSSTERERDRKKWVASGDIYIYIYIYIYNDILKYFKKLF